MNHTKKAVIFDLDGTLVDNRASFAKAYRAMCARYPNLFDEQDGEAEQLLIRFYRSSFARDAYRALCDHLAPRRLQLPTIDCLHEEWGMTYAENAIALPCAEGTLQYLREKSYRIGLPPASGQRFIPADCAHTLTTSLFRGITRLKSRIPPFTGCRWKGLGSPQTKRCLSAIPSRQTSTVQSRQESTRSG